MTQSAELQWHMPYKGESWWCCGRMGYHGGGTIGCLPAAPWQRRWVVLAWRETDNVEEEKDKIKI